MILNMPLPQILKITITASAIKARIQFVDALLTADGCQTQTDTDNDRAGYNRGKKTHNLFYTDQANDQSKHQIQKSCHHEFRHRHMESFSALDILAKAPVFSLEMVAKPPRNAKDEPRKAGTLPLEQK